MDENNNGNDSSNGLKIKVVILLALVMIIVAAGTSYFFMVYFNSTTQSNGEVEEKEEEKIGHTFSVGDFVVNLSLDRSYNFLKASIEVEVDKKDVLNELEERTPQIRDIIITILREQSLDNIREPDAAVIKNQISVKLNQILNSGKVTEVWFTELVVQ